MNILGAIVSETLTFNNRITALVQKSAWYALKTAVRTKLLEIPSYLGHTAAVIMLVLLTLERHSGLVISQTLNELREDLDDTPFFRCRHIPYPVSRRLLPQPQKHGP